jgi:probable DNA metabolism protein
MMISLRYDGTFEGLLTVLAGIIREDMEIQEITAGEIPVDLFTEIHEVVTDPVVASRFFEGLQKRISRMLLLDIGYCFLSEEIGIEKLLLDYLRLLLVEGERVNTNLSNSTVFKIQRTCDRVNHEILRMQGFIRFRKLKNGVYFAPISPDHNIIQLLAPHFKARFADQRWLIHDTRRKTGIYYNGNQVQYIPFVEMSVEMEPTSRPFTTELQSNLLDSEELDYQKLWNQYFEKIAITERQNKRQQRQRMPERYWRYLIEKVEG